MVCLTLALSLGACTSSQGTATDAAMKREADMRAIGQIEVSWHKASSTKDIDLIMSLWADDAIATIGGQTYSEKAQIRNFFLTKAAPFKAENNWVSVTPAYKTRVTIDGDRGTLYFECHNLDLDTQKVMSVVAADMNVVKANGTWLITNVIMTAPPLTP